MELLSKHPPMNCKYAQGGELTQSLIQGKYLLPVKKKGALDKAPFHTYI